MFETLENFINSEALLKLTTILLTFLSTYFVAKYNLNNPRKLKIKQLQFDNVYLPLYKLIYKDINQSISKELAVKYSIRIKTILHKNFELAFPQLNVLTDKFIDAIKNNKDYQSLFNKICYQVSVEYSLLTKSLGYPSENSYALFKRMILKDKLKNILEWGSLIYVFSSPFLFVVIWGTSNLYFFIVVFSLSIFVLIKLQNLINKMPD
ncbi:MAG: hypothetical protein KH415_22865 [Clostridium sp.]|nr:hypothetical protein [Clostridium sp.]